MLTDLRDLARIGRGGTVSRNLARAIVHSDLPLSPLMSFAVIGRPRRGSKTVIAERDGITLELDLSEDLHRLVYLDLHERELAGVMFAGMRDGGLLVDVGANFGYWSLHAAARGSSAIAFEPNPATRERLGVNLTLNPALCNIDIRPVAISDRAHNVVLRVPTSGESGQASLHGAEHDQQVVVQASTLDAELAQVNQTIDILKVDVEGHEAQVFAGADRTFSELRPRMVVVELVRSHLARAGKRSEDITRWLMSRGYEPTHWLPERWMPRGGVAAKTDPGFLTEPTLPNNICGNSVWAPAA